MCMRPRCPTPPYILLAIHPLRSTTPPLRGSRVRMARSLLVAGVHSVMVDAGGVCACVVSLVIYAAWWPCRRPWCPTQFCWWYLPFPGPPLLSTVRLRGPVVALFHSAPQGPVVALWVLVAHWAQAKSNTALQGHQGEETVAQLWK